MLDTGRFLQLQHPEYGLVYYEIMKNNQHCACGADDAYVLEVAVDLDFSLKDSVVYPADARVGSTMTVCDKVLQHELKVNHTFFKLQPQKNDDIRRNMILADDKDI